MSGEQLKMGDEKLEELVSMIHVLFKEFGNPISNLLMNYVWVYKIVNNIGILKTVSYMKNMLNFTGSVLTDHKNRHIDGNCTF